jgi:hypothetical protein
LACGDGGLGDALLARELAYHGIDSTSEMVESARRRLAGRAEVELGDLNDYAPAEPVAATTVFRAIYYARDRAAFFRHVGGFTEKKLVFDLNPRQYEVDDVLADLCGGIPTIALRPFLRRRRPGPPPGAGEGTERGGPLARLVLRFASPTCSSVPLRAEQRLGPLVG